MTRRKQGKAVNGWLILDKPAGMTSTQAVGAVRRLFDARKAGHAGTLDPLATGILPIAFGEATKTVSFVVDGAKAYRFEVRWGEETDTDDAEGKIVRTSPQRPSRADIEAMLTQFIGEILQTPPQFSAVKIDGNRAYDLARDGEHVVIEPRPVVIDSLRLVDMPDADTAVFEAECGKGCRRISLGVEHSSRSGLAVPVAAGARDAGCSGTHSGGAQVLVVRRVAPVGLAQLEQRDVVNAPISITLDRHQEAGQKARTHG